MANRPICGAFIASNLLNRDRNRNAFSHHKLSQPSSHQPRLHAAQGYIELGMFLDANEELEDIDPEQRDRSDVLALRVKIYSGLKKWILMQTVARVLALRDPDNTQWSVSWADATRRADSIEAARLILLEAVERIPTAAILHYNLACYECQLGDLEVAKARLQHAFKLEPGYREKALDEIDLEPIWEPQSL